MNQTTYHQQFCLGNSQYIMMILYVIPRIVGLEYSKLSERYMLFFLSVRSKTVDANPSILNRSEDLKQMGQRHFSTAVALMSTEKNHSGRGSLGCFTESGTVYWFLSEG